MLGDTENTAILKMLSNMCSKEVGRYELKKKYLTFSYRNFGFYFYEELLFIFLSFSMKVTSISSAYISQPLSSFPCLHCPSSGTCSLLLSGKICGKATVSRELLWIDTTARVDAHKPYSYGNGRICP